MSYASRTRRRIFGRLFFISLLLGIGGLGVYYVLFKQDKQVAADDGFQDELLAKISGAVPGETIKLPPGRFYLSQPLRLMTENLILAGSGSDKTLLSFAPMESLRPAISIEADNSTVSELTIIDSPGTAISVSNVRNATVLKTETSWNTRGKRNNGEYGIAVLRSKNVLVDSNTIKGARSSGVFVLDSENIVARDNRLSGNVIGLQIASGRAVDVLGNNILENSMGVLLVDLPGQADAPGAGIRLFRNEIISNNKNNLSSSTELSHMVFTGVGIAVLGADEIEIFDNSLARNDASNVIILSRDINKFPQLGVFDPYPENINIHHNRMRDAGMAPAQLSEVQGISLSLPYPDVLYDGAINPLKVANGKPRPNRRVCLLENSQLRVANLDISKAFGGLSRRIDTLTCSLKSLPPVVLPLTM